jgi:RNA polymerase sigma factor for flagellar operon FliA
VRTVYLTSLASLGEHQEPAADDEPVTERLDRRRLTERLAKAIDTLPDRERQLMVKHYWEGKNLLEAGAELGVSKSWASRLHAQAVDRLRGLLDDA